MCITLLLETVDYYVLYIYYRRKKRFKDVVGTINPLTAVTKAKLGANQWMDYCVKKRTGVNKCKQWFV